MHPEDEPVVTKEDILEAINKAGDEIEAAQEALNRCSRFLLYLLDDLDG